MITMKNPFCIYPYYTLDMRGNKAQNAGKQGDKFPSRNTIFRIWPKCYHFVPFWSWENFTPRDGYDTILLFAPAAQPYTTQGDAAWTVCAR